MEVLELGAPETAPPPGQAHTHSQLGFRELMSFENYARAAAKQEEARFSWKFRARAAQCRRRPDPVSS